MEKSIQNQKVFVSLAGVLELQAEIERLAKSGDSTRDYVRGLIRAAKILELPVTYIYTKFSDKGG